jgi:hypothetical protein
VDCTTPDAKRTCERLGVDGFPTLKVIGLASFIDKPPFSLSHTEAWYFGFGVPYIRCCFFPTGIHITGPHSTRPGFVSLDPKLMIQPTPNEIG